MENQQPRRDRLRIGGWTSYVVLVTLGFLQPLAGLLALARVDGFHSYIPLVPLVSGWLFYVQRGGRATLYRTSLGGTLAAVVLGFAAMAAIAMRGSLTGTDQLALLTLAYLSLVAAGALVFLGSKWMAATSFPIAFLIFMVPLPSAAVHWLSTASVLASADAAALFFNMTRTPLVRDGTLFQLPGISLMVARECSGLRSSWVLFITSVVSSYLILATPWRRILLVSSVIPLAITRNAFRIFVIGLLCVHVDPQMIHSLIHHRGGPIFFGLSLVPLFLLARWLRRGERRRSYLGKPS